MFGLLAAESALGQRLLRSAFVLLGAALAVAACGKPGERAGEGGAATLTLGDLAGKWTVEALPADRDTVLVTYELNAAATAEGWSMTLPGRSPVSLHVMPPSGDSVVIHAGPYESVLRPGVSVTTENVLRLANGQLVGSFVALYQGGGAADSVLKGRLRGRRSP
jgi:hypothetical protein